MIKVYQKIASLENEGIRAAALCTIVNTKGSTPRKAGAKMLVLLDEQIVGTIGGGSLEKKVIADALEVIANKKPQLFSHALVHDHGMCCGGSIEIFIEPIMARKKLYIFGAGHIGKALAKFAQQLNFKVHLIDERSEMFEEEVWLVKEQERTDADGIQTHIKNHRRLFKANELLFDADTFICVVTHDHAYDRAIVAHCAKQPHAYLGMIGSERKVLVAKKAFLAGKLLTQKEMKHIDWPMGITNIKVQTPTEIAIAIIAKLIDVRAKMDAD